LRDTNGQVEAGDAVTESYLVEVSTVAFGGSVRNYLHHWNKNFLCVKNFDFSGIYFDSVDVKNPNAENHF
jgi:hypothetical protein